MFYQANIEKHNKGLQNDISDGSQRLEDLGQALNDADMVRKKLSIEKADMEKQMEEAENQLRSLGKLKTSLSTQVCMPPQDKLKSLTIFCLSRLQCVATMNFITFKSH